MPTTSVAKSNGATMVRIKRRKIRLRTRRLAATPGKSWPTSAPITIDTRIHVVSDFRRMAKKTSAAITAQRATANRLKAEAASTSAGVYWVVLSARVSLHCGSGGIGRRASLRS